MPSGAQDRPLELVLSEDLLASLDEWRRRQADRPPRHEAVKKHLEQALRGATSQSITPAQLTSENDT